MTDTTTGTHENIIIVGVDGSETAKKAADAAAHLAASIGARLHVIMAYARDETEVIGDGSEQWLLSTASDAEAIASAAALAARKITATVTSSAALGKPADVLLNEAERLDARAIVVGNKHMQGIRRVLGSVPNSVAHRANCDVYIVKTV